MGRRLKELRASAAWAHAAPLVVFLGVLALVPVFKVEHSMRPWYERAPEHWIYPLQVVLCGVVLAFFWHHYRFRPFRGNVLAVVLGLVTIAVWIAPSRIYLALGVDDAPDWWRWFGLAPRDEGFDPNLFGDQPAAYAATVFLRFFRMVVIVPLVEEIFWRGFLMRWLVDTDRPFTETPFGTYHPGAVAGTTVAFMLAHAPVDWAGALVFGVAMAWVAIKTKSLWACVLMHAVANLALGIYVMATGQWGFW